MADIPPNHTQIKMKPFVHIAILIAFAITASACTKKIRGQVFVVTKSRENVKIGLAPVYFITNESFRTIAEDTVTMIETEEGNRSQRESDVKAFANLTDEIKSIVESLKAQNPQSSPASLDNINNTIKLYKLAAPCEELLLKLHPNAYSKNLDQFLTYRDRFIESIQNSASPTGSSIIRTDADGRFEIEISSGGWLVSYAERKVADSTETYLWITPVEAKSGTSNDMVLLSNESDAGSIEALHAIASQAAESTKDLNEVRETSVNPSLAQLLAEARVTVEMEERTLLSEIEKSMALKAEEARLVRERDELEEAESKAGRAEVEGLINSGVIGSTLPVRLPGGVKLELAWCPPGEFLMGDQANFGAQSRTVINDGFWIGRSEVTQVQWNSVMSSNPSKFEGADLPVANMTWSDAFLFVLNLNSSQILPDGWTFSLPTEVQWEYACRAGSAGNYSGDLEAIGWYAGNSNGTPHKVREKSANRAGLFDMHGNVAEWCSDRRFSQRISSGASIRSGSIRVYRGGSWEDNADECQATSRVTDLSENESHYAVGFRVVILQEQ